MSGDIEERLAAWIDGALSPDEAKAFEAEMARDPALAARAASWKANDAFIAGAFAPVADVPIDPELMVRLGLADKPGLAAANDNSPWWRRSLPLAGGAIAAGLALVLMLNGLPRGASSDPLSLALDTTPSLHTAKLADGRTIEPRLTVRAADGRWCREYASAGKVALACRDGKNWKVVGEGADTAKPARGGEVVLAGGSDGSALDAAYAAIGASDPVDASREAQLIAGDWKSR